MTIQFSRFTEYVPSSSTDDSSITNIHISFSQASQAEEGINDITDHSPSSGGQSLTPHNQPQEKPGSGLMEMVMMIIMTLLMPRSDNASQDDANTNGNANGGGNGDANGNDSFGYNDEPQPEQQTSYIPPDQQQPVSPQGAPIAQQPVKPQQTPAEQQAPAIPQQTPAAPAPLQQPSVPSGPGNTVTYVNDGDKPMHLKFTPNADSEQIPDLILQPGESKPQSFPPGWSGNWRSTAGGGNSQTLGEVKFQGGVDGKTTFYDDSRIEGSNMGEIITPASGGRRTGTMDNLLENAPSSVLAYDANGKPYGIRKSTVNDVQDPAVVNFLRQHIPIGDGYTYPTDDASTASTQDTHLIVHMRDFV